MESWKLCAGHAPAPTYAIAVFCCSRRFVSFLRPENAPDPMVAIELVRMDNVVTLLSPVSEFALIALISFPSRIIVLMWLKPVNAAGARD